MASSDEELADDWGPFLVPPPPPPPSLGTVCSSSEFYCQVEGGPMGAHFNRASFPSLPIIAVCSSVVLVTVLVASFLLWRHKTKVQNLLPCKSEPQGPIGGAANGVSYEDVLGNHHPTRIPQGHLAGSQTLMPLEMLDVKLGDLSSSPIAGLHHVPYYPPSGQVVGKPFHPVYEEVSQAAMAMAAKNYGTAHYQSGAKLNGHYRGDNDFAAEVGSEGGSGQCSATSSVRGSTGGDLCRDPVSSDEGVGGQDCDYTISDLPEMVASGNSFSYSRQPASDRTKLRKQPRGDPHATYPHGERTMNAPVVQRAPEPHHRHSRRAEGKRHKSPSHVQSYAPHVLRGSNDPMLSNTQWGYGGSSQENIYSTIDEDDVVPNYPVHPPLTSLACSQRGTSSAAPKRHPLENGTSYGDMMPAFHSAFM